MDFYILETHGVLIDKENFGTYIKNGR